MNAKRAYVYPTRYGLLAIESGKYRKLQGFQPGVSYATAEGYVVPPQDIYGCLPIGIEWALDKIGGIAWESSTSEKGAKAVEVVSLLLKKGYFPMWALPEVISDLDLQIRGLDIVVRQTVRIQVKCDYEGGSPLVQGERGKRVTGNLYLQVAERNPFKSV